jgi:predicted HAD superfamily hydrolase
MVYQILDDEGNVLNTINADLAFVTEHYPGHWKDITPSSPEPEKEMVITKLAFKRRFTMQELVAFKTLTQTDVTAEVFDDLINIAEDVTLDDPMLISGMDYLVSVGILTEERNSEILAG